MGNLPTNRAGGDPEHLADHNALHALYNLYDAKGDLVVGSGVDLAAKLTVGANGTVLTADSTAATGVAWATPAGGGGGGSAWTQQLNLPLTSLTNWTAGSGAWTAEVDRIRQATVNNATNRLYYGNRTSLPLAELVAEVEVRIDSSNNNTSSRAGMSFGTPATDANGGALISLRAGSATHTDVVDFENDGVTNYGNAPLAATIAHGTWMTLRVHKVGFHYVVKINGVQVASWRVDQSSADMARLALYSYATDASFRNLKVWTPALPA